MVMSRATRQAWAAARVDSVSVPDVLAQPDVLDQLILWRMGDPRYVDRNNQLRSKPMTQRQWTIEARADFADKEKNDAIDQAFKVAAAHINATMALLSDGQKPQVVCFSDDFFAGHVDIDWLGDPLGKAIAANAQASGETAEVSDEMLAAVRDMRGS